MKTPVHFLLLLVFAALIGAHAPAQSQQPARPDITGGAAFIFKRPQNPETSTRKRSGEGASDQVEDAIALGNAARDRTPPDFESAEKAYRLAWKLNPRDPRPYVGLGNIYWDQRRYPEAATAYRDALRYIARPTVSFGVLSTPSGMGGNPGARVNLSSRTETRVYLAATFLQEQKFLVAERELREAISSDSKNPEWNAMLGYALSSQGRYTEASGAYENAVRFAPDNEEYKELQRQSSLKAREASNNDQAMTAQLENTTWKTGAGACELSTKGAMRCTDTSDTPASPAARWRVRDGLFELEDATGVPFCVGRPGEKSIELKCSVGDVEKNWRWTK